MNQLRLRPMGVLEASAPPGSRCPQLSLPTLQVELLDSDFLCTSTVTSRKVKSDVRKPWPG